MEIAAGVPVSVNVETGVGGGTGGTGTDVTGGIGTGVETTGGVTGGTGELMGGVTMVVSAAPLSITIDFNFVKIWRAVKLRTL
jgi:hypothetical protein